MSNQLQTNLDKILQDKNTNLLPENLKQGITCLGVEGTMQAGVDTSDANATADDIANGKTAYVNGQKITGTIPVQSSAFSAKAYNSQDQKEYNQIRFYANNDTKTILDKGIMVQVYTDYTELAETLGLTPEKIKSGETILGITGTYTGEVTE